MSYNAQLLKDRETPPSTLHLFCNLSHGYFASPNATYLPEIPPISDELKTVYDGLRPRFAYDDWFYLAFVPKQIRYDIPLFDCLAPLACRLERVETANGTYHRMYEPLIKQWTALEEITVRVQKKLLQRIAGTYLETLVPPYPSRMGFWRVWKTRNQALLAIRHSRTVFTLRFAFLSWLVLRETRRGRRTWTDLASDPNDPIPLAICNSFGSYWISDFTVPRVGAFVDMRGQQLPDAGRQWHEDLPAMIEAGIPIWFAYHKEPTPCTRMSTITLNERKRHLPAKWAVDILDRVMRYGSDIGRNRHLAQSLRDKAEYSANVEPSAMYGYIPQLYRTPQPPSQAFIRLRKHETIAYDLTWTQHGVDIGTGRIDSHSHASVENDLLRYRYRQCVGDTYETFIEREEQLAANLVVHETSAERLKRFSRETFNITQPVPTKNGPIVYAWIVEENGHVRTRVDHDDVPELWTRTLPSDRRYNSFRDEYDVLLRLDDEVDQAASVSNGDSRRSRSASPIPRTPRPSRPRTPTRIEPTASIGGQIEDRHLTHRVAAVRVSSEDGQREAQEVGSLREMAQTLLEYDSAANSTGERCDLQQVDSDMRIVQARYGYSRPQLQWKARTKEAREWMDTQKFTKMFRTLAIWEKDEDRVGPRLTTQELEPLADFAATVKDGRSAPAELSDLCQPPRPLMSKREYDSLVVTRHLQEVNSVDGTATATPWNVLRSLNGIPLLTTSNCILATNMATNVLHLKRADFGQTADAILEALVLRGMRVRLLRRFESDTLGSPLASTATIGNRPLGVGVKPHGVQLTREDYTAYRRMRDDLLKGPAGRAALLQGGIVWRLAQGTCTIEDAARGPETSDPISQSQTRIQLIEGESYIESSLTQQDQYIIVGVYRVLQRECIITHTAPYDRTDPPMSHQTKARENKEGEDTAAITSWWPTDEVWAASGYSTGHWSRDAEKWFQRRLERIRSGEAKALSSNEWRKGLRHCISDSQKFISGIETLSRKILYDCNNA